MDGWETRRKRVAGHDWCIIKLGLAGRVHGVELDTSYFTGNYAPRASVQAARLDSDPVIAGGRGSCRGVAATREQEVSAARLGSHKWDTLVPQQELGAGYSDTCRTFCPVQGGRGHYTHIRLNIFPDGGVARCRVYGVAAASVPRPLLDADVDIMDVASVELGGLCVAYSDAHYGHPRNLIKPGTGKDMGDGWETARRLDRPAVLEADYKGILQVPGSEWAVLRLGVAVSLSSVETVVVDTNHFKGNYPDSVLLEVTTTEASYPHDKEEVVSSSCRWRPLLPPSKLRPHQLHTFTRAQGHLATGGDQQAVTHVRVKMFPDGGISRIRIMATPSNLQSEE